MPQRPTRLIFSQQFLRYSLGFEEISQEVQMKTKEKVESHCAHRISLNLCFSRDRKMSKPEQTIERFEELMKKKLMNSDVCKNQFWLLISSQDAKSWKQQTLLRLQPSHWFLKLWIVRFLIKLYNCDKSLMKIQRTTCSFVITSWPWNDSKTDHKLTSSGKFHLEQYPLIT